MVSGSVDDRDLSLEIGVRPATAIALPRCGGLLSDQHCILHLVEKIAHG